MIIGSGQWHNAYGTVAQVLDSKHYAVLLNWGQRIEATYDRTEEMTSFDAGDHVFLQKVPGSRLWVIIGHAFGSASSTSPSIGWFQVDNDTFGRVDGPGRVIP